MHGIIVPQSLWTYSAGPGCTLRIVISESMQSCINSFCTKHCVAFYIFRKVVKNKKGRQKGWHSTNEQEQSEFDTRAFNMKLFKNLLPIV